MHESKSASQIIFDTIADRAALRYVESDPDSSSMLFSIQVAVDRLAHSLLNIDEKSHWLLVSYEIVDKINRTITQQITNEYGVQVQPVVINHLAVGIDHSQIDHDVARVTVSCATVPVGCDQTFSVKDKMIVGEQQIERNDKIEDPFNW